jgi:methylase of polypeptide subunit release factors
VDALLGDLDEPLPTSLRRRVDVVTAVVPYVPTEELHLLPRDVLAHEPHRALDGGPRGTVVLERAARAATRWLRPGGSLLLELGGEQADELSTPWRRPACRRSGCIGTRRVATARSRRADPIRLRSHGSRTAGSPD